MKGKSGESYKGDIGSRKSKGTDGVEFTFGKGQASTGIWDLNDFLKDAGMFPEFYYASDDFEDDKDIEKLDLKKLQTDSQTVIC